MTIRFSVIKTTESIYEIEVEGIIDGDLLNYIDDDECNGALIHQFVVKESITVSE